MGVKLMEEALKSSLVNVISQETQLQVDILVRKNILLQDMGVEIAHTQENLAILIIIVGEIIKEKKNTEEVVEKDQGTLVTDLDLETGANNTEKEDTKEAIRKIEREAESRKTENELSSHL